VTELKRSLNFTHLLFYGVGTIVGAGIYSIIGSAAQTAGPAVWISFVLASVAALITALSYAELVSAFPRAGAEYHFLREAFPQVRLLAFLGGLLIALNAAATSATVALAFGGYLNVFLKVPIGLAAFILLIVCTMLNIAGIREATWVSMGLIGIEVGGLLVFIIFGIPHAQWERAFVLPSLDLIPNVIGVAALVFFVYIGFQDVANLAQEAKQAEKHVPWALLISVLITSAIYLIVVFVAIAIDSIDAMAASNAPLEAAARRIHPALGKLLGITALFATASTALISLVSISRLLYGMAQGSDMPKILGKTWKRRQTPWVAALFLFIGASVLLTLEHIKIVASVSSLGMLIVFIAVQTAMIVLRYTQPALKRSFFVPGSIGKLPVLPLIGIAITFVLLLQFETKIYAIVTATLLSGWAGYRLRSAYSGAQKP